MCPVILACGTDYSIVGQPVTSYIEAASLATLSPDAVHDRVCISHEGWTPLLGNEKPFHALARKMRCGGDPFDAGHGLTFDSK